MAETSPEKWFEDQLNEADHSPELDPNNLVDKRKLPVTSDFCALFADVAGIRLNIDGDSCLRDDREDTCLL